MMLFWVLAPCRLDDRCQRFGEILCLHLQGKTLHRFHLLESLFTPLTPTLQHASYILQTIRVTVPKRDCLRFVLCIKAIKFSPTTCIQQKCILHSGDILCNFELTLSELSERSVSDTYTYTHERCSESGDPSQMTTTTSYPIP
jgi:hypothetical protein